MPRPNSPNVYINRKLYQGLLICYTELLRTYETMGVKNPVGYNQGLAIVAKNKTAAFDKDIASTPEIEEEIVSKKGPKVRTADYYAIKVIAETHNGDFVLSRSPVNFLYKDEIFGRLCKIFEDNLELSDAIAMDDKYNMTSGKASAVIDDIEQIFKIECSDSLYTMFLNDSTWNMQKLVEILYLVGHKEQIEGFEGVDTYDKL